MRHSIGSEPNLDLTRPKACQHGSVNLMGIDLYPAQAVNPTLTSHPQRPGQHGCGNLMGISLYQTTSHLEPWEPEKNHSSLFGPLRQRM